MIKYLTVLLVALAAGCAGGDTKDPNVLERDDAVDDYIQVAAPPATQEIRSRTQVHHKRITDKYIILYDRRNNWLVEFRSQCRELRDNTDIRPDIRHESNVIRARFDTYRGCHINAIYEVSKGQAEELLALGD